MNHLARKKVVFVIVEGPSDDTALGIALNQLFDKNTVYVHILHGDITTRKGVCSTNVVSKLGDEIKSYADSMHFEKTDFLQIIHIVDTDAVYIPEKSIIVDEGLEGFVYLDDGIHAADKDKVLSRNKQKIDNLLRLRRCPKIWEVPYRVYYMSCNLDHVLYNKRNSSDDEKEQDAYDFAKKYRNDVSAFLKYMCESDFSIKGDYKESWNYIEEGMHSIERYTNLPICLDGVKGLKQI